MWTPLERLYSWSICMTKVLLYSTPTRLTDWLYDKDCGVVTLLGLTGGKIVGMNSEDILKAFEELEAGADAKIEARVKEVNGVKGKLWINPEAIKEFPKLTPETADVLKELIRYEKMGDFILSDKGIAPAESK